MRGVECESEIGRIDRIRRLAGAPRGSGVVLGIGDDCAIFRQRGAAEDLVFTTDMLIEGVHFERATHRAEDAGWKALARGLSDIAAMGAEPRFCLVSLALPDATPSDWLDGFYRGLLRLARREKTATGRRRFGPRRQSDVRHRGLRIGAARPGSAPRWRARGRWHLRQRRTGRVGLGLIHHMQAKPGGGTCGPSRASPWAVFCAKGSAQPRLWISAMGFRSTSGACVWHRN